MQIFYKIMTDGFLSTGSGTVIPLGYTTDFSLLELDLDGNYYTYYNQDGTPNLVKEAELASELTYNDLVNQLEAMVVQYDGHIFSGNIQAQSFIVAMLTKIEGESPQATRNIYAIDGRTKVPMTKTKLLELISIIDIAQEALTEI